MTDRPTGPATPDDYDAAADALDYLDRKADLAGDGERAMAFTEAGRILKARIPAIQRQERARIFAALPAALWRAHFAETPEEFIGDWQRDLDNAFEWYVSPNEMAAALAAALEKELEGA